MSSLLDLQKKFIASFQTIADESFLNEIQPRQRLTQREQLAIYQNSICGRFQNILRTTYPICERLVGRDFFLNMINSYIAEMPSYSKDLNDYGYSFATFITMFPPAKALLYLSDVAHLEWAWQYLDNAPNSAVFDFQKLAACESDTEKMVFLLPPHSTLITSPYPIHRIWEVNQDDHTDKTVILDENQTYYFLVWRTAEQKRIDLLTKSQWQVLTWINQSLPFAKICEMTETEGNIFMPEILPALIKKGWIVDFKEMSSKMSDSLM